MTFLSRAFEFEVLSEKIAALHSYSP